MARAGVRHHGDGRARARPGSTPQCATAYTTRGVAITAASVASVIRRSVDGLHAQQDAAGRASSGRGEGTRIQRDLTAVDVESLVELTIGLEVDDRPSVSILEREVELPLDERAIVEPQRDWRLTQALTALTSSPVLILLCVNAMLLALGTLMDMAALIVILTPILLPVVTAVGVHPVHFGMIMIVNLGIGLITPPVGTVLFVGSAVAGLPIERVVRALLPFLLLLLAVLAIVTFVPAVSLWLPRTLGL